MFFNSELPSPSSISGWPINTDFAGTGGSGGGIVVVPDGGPFEIPDGGPFEIPESRRLEEVGSDGVDMTDMYVLKTCSALDCSFLLAHIHNPFSNQVWLMCQYSRHYRLEHFRSVSTNLKLLPSFLAPVLILFLLLPFRQTRGCMAGLFADNLDFNQSIGDWDVSLNNCFNSM